MAIDRIKIAKNFYLDEYIDEETYVKYHKKPHYLAGRINPRLVLLDQFLRDRFGAITINNWWHEGDRQWSGMRTPKSPYYSKWSQHGDFANASDKLFANYSAEEVRQDIKDNYEKLYEPMGLTCIEDNVSWLHSDLRFHQFKGYKGTHLLIVKP